MIPIPTLRGALVAFALLACTGAAAPPHAPSGTGLADLKVAIATERTRAPAPRLPRASFLAHPVAFGAVLAPDGTQVAYLRKDGPRRGVWLLPASGGAPRMLVVDSDAQSLAFSHDGRWLLLLSPRRVQAVPLAGGRAGARVLTLVGGRTRREVLAIDPVRPAAVLVVERPSLAGPAPRRWRLLRVEVEGRESVLHVDAHQIVDVALDASGRPAWLLRARGAGHDLLQLDANGRMAPRLRCEQMRRCLLVGTLGSDLLLRTHGDDGLEALWRMRRDGSRERLHADPRGEADLDEVVLDPRDGTPLLASYRSTQAHTEGLTAEARVHLAALARRFPGRDLRLAVGRGPQARWLVRELGSQVQGERLYLYAPATGAVREILADGFVHDGVAFGRLPETSLARTWPFAWQASDGRRVHGLLTVPPGVDAATAPLVVEVHGGPFNRVRPGFGRDAQFLANRGYLVFQPNFRGSTGFGRDYLLAAHGDFGNGRVQADIVEGVRALLATGIGDGRRVAIAGASFGGYSALLGATFAPELFRVGIAAVPPADFGWVLREYVGSGAQMVPGVPIATSMRDLGLDPADAALARRLTAQSPIANAARLRRPVLVLAGGEDERVPIRGVTAYAARLRTLGNADVTLFIDADGKHQAAEPLTREAYYFLMETLLHRHLGGPVPPPPSKALAAHVRRNLRLRGRDFSQ